MDQYTIDEKVKELVAFMQKDIQLPEEVSNEIMNITISDDEIKGEVLSEIKYLLENLKKFNVEGFVEEGVIEELMLLAKKGESSGLINIYKDLQDVYLFAMKVFYKKKDTIVAPVLEQRKKDVREKIKEFPIENQKLINILIEPLIGKDKESMN